MNLVSSVRQQIENKTFSSDDLVAAERLVADSLTCCVGALASSSARPLIDWARSQPASALRNAWLLAGLSNLLELDSMHVASAVHPGTVVVPAALAVAAEVDATYTALLQAVLRGTEAAAWLGRATGKPHRQRFQSTSTCGGFGASLACADLYGMPAAQRDFGMANVLSTAGGLWAFVDVESGTKQWHAGHAAHSAVFCAQLARAGLTGPLNVIESPRGFLATLCEGSAPAELQPKEKPWAAHELAYKPWPSPRPTHPAIHVALKARELCWPCEIRQIIVRTFGQAVDLCNRPVVRNAHEARFSLQFLTAAALRFGKIDLKTFEPEIIDSVSKDTALISVEVDEAMNARYPAESPAAVEIFTADGGRYLAETDFAPGDPAMPLDQEQERAKRDMLLCGSTRLEEEFAAFGDGLQPLRDKLNSLFSCVELAM